MLKRIWPTILTFVIIFSLLSWLLLPRPSEVLRFTGDANVYADEFCLSPDDKLLVAVNSELRIIDLHSRQNLLSVPYTNDQFGFDSQGRFVWVELKRAPLFLEEGLLISLWRFDPSTRQKVKLMERLHCLIEKEGDYDQSAAIHLFGGKHRLGHFQEFALLSPDCSTLLIPRYTYTTATYELIDIESGKIRARLELPAIQIYSTSTQLLEAEFSKDGQLLLTQTEDRLAENTYYRLRLFSTTTGKEITSLQLPEMEKLNKSEHSFSSRSNGFNRLCFIARNSSRLGPILYFDAEKVVAKNTLDIGDGTKGMMLVEFAIQSVKTIAFDGHPPSQQQAFKDTSHNLVHAEIRCYPNQSKQEVFICTQYDIEAFHYSPFMQFSHRSLVDGRLLDAATFTFPDLNEKVVLEANTLLPLLPGNRVLIKQTNSVLESDSKIIKWIDKVKDWLQISSPRKMFVINTTQGTCENLLSLDINIHSAHLLSSSQTIVFTGNDNREGNFLHPEIRLSAAQAVAVYLLLVHWPGSYHADFLRKLPTIPAKKNLSTMNDYLEIS